jgi:hypothetical protein
MGFLGLDGTEVKDDNLFQRMFWPSDHAGEADTLGKQGFWVCWIVGFVSMLMLSFQGQPIAGLFTLAFFCLGGIGVREHSQPAAILVAAAYLLNIVASLFVGVPPGALTIIICLLLVANIRGTYVAAKWQHAGGDDAMPTRFNESFTDKLVDQMPRSVWPKTKILFFVGAGLYLLLSVLGAVMIAMHVPQRLKARQQQAAPSSTIEVAPPR